MSENRSELQRLFREQGQSPWLDNLKRGYLVSGELARMVERGRTTAPYAFVIPRDQRHAAEAADLVDYFRKVGSEVHVASAAFTTLDMPAVIERGLVAGGAGAAAAGPSGGGRSGRGGRGGDSTAMRGS